MPRMLLALLFSLFLMTCRGPAYAQASPEDTQEGASEDEAAQQPESPKHKSTIIVENNLLSVEFVNVSFGEILQSISQKAGFQLEGSSAAFIKQVTTKFNDLDIDKGLVRLFSYVREANYYISYDAKGSIAKLKIPSAKAVGKTSSYAAPPGAPPRQRTLTPVRRRFRRSQQPAGPGSSTPVPQPEPSQPEETEEAPAE